MNKIKFFLCNQNHPTTFCQKRGIRSNRRQIFILIFSKFKTVAGKNNKSFPFHMKCYAFSLKENNDNAGLINCIFFIEWLDFQVLDHLVTSWFTVNFRTSTTSFCFFIIIFRDSSFVEQLV